MRPLLRTIFATLLAGLLGCAPRDVIPGGPNHPANPDSASTHTQTGGHEGMDMSGHDGMDMSGHDGMDMGGHDGMDMGGHGGMDMSGDGGMDMGGMDMAGKDGGMDMGGMDMGGKDGGPKKATPMILNAGQKKLMAVEMAAYERAKPVFTKYCAPCHSTGGKKSSPKRMMHFSIDSYPFGGHHAANIGFEVRNALGAEKEEASMPADSPGIVQGDELARIVAWSRTFDAAKAAGLHGGKAK